jgi:hypothetical protein
VVPCTDDHGRALRDRRRALACHPREPRTELLQPSQAKGRFGESEVSTSRFFGCGLVGRRYLRR